MTVCSRLPLGLPESYGSQKCQGGVNLDLGRGTSRFFLIQASTDLEDALHIALGAYVSPGDMSPPKLESIR